MPQTTQGLRHDALVLLEVLAVVVSAVELPVLPDVRVALAGGLEVAVPFRRMALRCGTKVGLAAVFGTKERIQ